MRVSDVNKNLVRIDVDDGSGKCVVEEYICHEPAMVVGNLVMGDRYAEP